MRTLVKTLTLGFPLPTKNQQRTTKLILKTDYLLHLFRMFLTNVLPVVIAFYASLGLAAKVCTVLLFLIALLVFWLTRWPKPRSAQFRRADHFRPDLVPKQPIDTIVIGSGSGGSTCANLLAQSGQVVLVLEQHQDVTGGCTHSFREQGCEWDTGLHYVGRAMGDRTKRPGAIMDFMTGGKQLWTPLQDPYDEVVFPADSQVKDGAPNNSRYCFYTGADNTVSSVVNSIDPNDAERLTTRLNTWMDICREINEGFVALGVSRLLPGWLHFLVKPKVDELMTYASYTVKDVQHAVFGLGYSPKEVLDGCPPAVENEDGE